MKSRQPVTPDRIRGCWNDEGRISCFVATLRIMGVGQQNHTRAIADPR
jgi:hypothetical protein